MERKFRVSFALTVAVILIIALTAGVIADTIGVDFETYTLGNVNGQDGWSMTGPYDVAVVNAIPYGYGTFGNQSLRISNAVTTGGFGDQTFAKQVVNEAGETAAYTIAPSGTRQPTFVAQWDFASTVPAAQQPGLSITASPDRGDGGRMSWIQMMDTPTGLEVNFYDYQDLPPYGSLANPADGRDDVGDGDDFYLTNIATGLARNVPHTIRIEMTLIDGPLNDVVKVYLDGVLKHTGTSWEDYFRWMQGPGDPEPTAPVHESRTVRTMLFRAGGAAVPATSGNGFLIDNLAISSCSGVVTNLNTAETFCTIQAAIDDPDTVNGHTVFVGAGTYDEDVNVNKSLSLLGAGPASTTIRGVIGGAGTTVQVAASNVTIAGFTITHLGNNPADWNSALNTAGIAVQGAFTGMTVHNNTLTGNRTGIDINDSSGHTIRNNVITDNRTGMILRNQTDNLTVVENEITNNWTVGIVFLDASSGSNVPVQTALNSTFSNNNFSGNWYGEIVERQTGGSLPLPGTTNLKNFSGNWFGTTAPVVSTANSTEPGYAAQIPVAYGGTAVPPITPQPDILGPASANIDFTPYLNSGTDTNVETTPGRGTYGFQGDFSNLWVTAAGAQTGATGRIQEGIDSVSGSTVNVADGTYEEAVVIDNQTVTLIGASLAAIVKAPTSIPVCTTTSYDWHPVICVKNGSTATIDTLTVDGFGRGNANNRFMGVALRNSAGTVKNSAIIDIRDTPFSGAQHGVAINAYNDDGTGRTINVLDNTVSGFQKNAMALNASATTPLTVGVQRNVVTGAGTTTVTAQNGIQVFADMGTGLVTDNTVSGIGYDNTLDPTKWVAVSILDYYADIDITDNTITGAQVGVYYIEGTGDILDNAITVNQIGNGGMWGVIATDPPDAVPSPFGVEDMLAATGDAPKAPDSTLTVAVSGNTVNFVGGSNTSTFGIEADAGYGVDDLAVTANGNTVTGFEVGIEIWQCQGSCAAGVFTGVVANNNCLYNNTYGMRSNATYITVDGERNWWGNASGPYNLAQNPAGTGNQVSDDIDFQPWINNGCPGSTTTGNWQNTTTLAYDDLQGSLDAANYGEEIIFVGTGLVGGGATSNNDGVTINLNGGTFGPGSPFLTVNSADMTVIGPATLDGNGSLDPAILVITGGDNFILDGVEVREWADGVEVANSVTSFKLVNNWIHSNTDAGLQVNSGVSFGGVVTIQGNLFKVNGGNGVQNNGATTNLNVEYNSWGDVGGPAVGVGDGVGGSVDYTPWTFAETYIDVDPIAGGDQYQRNVDESTSFNVELKLEAADLYGLAFQFSYDPTYLTFNGPPTFSAPWSGN